MNQDIIKFQEFLKSDGVQKKTIEPITDEHIKEVYDEENISDLSLTEERINYLINDFGITEEELSKIIEVDQVEDITESNQNFDEYYNLYRDVNENFTCDIFIEGANVEKSSARLIIESQDWNLVFNGQIIDGKCIIPVKKLDILKENSIGSIKLEVIAENNVFIPWQNKFCVKSSKKISVTK
jgi:hypothetical protein